MFGGVVLGNGFKPVERQGWRRHREGQRPSWATSQVEFGQLYFSKRYVWLQSNTTAEHRDVRD